MLVRLGERQSSTSLVDLLLACHARIRRFTRGAIELATAASPSLEETSGFAEQIRRYFVEAFPLHIADEDELIAPRLAGTSTEIDRALTIVSADHTEHTLAVTQLVAICAELAVEPSRLANRSRLLADAGQQLWVALEPHLALEERYVFPAIALLPAQEREALRRGMRERRGSRS